MEQVKLLEGEELFRFIKREFSLIYGHISGFIFYREEGDYILVKTASTFVKKFLNENFKENKIS